jgi:hypothetical protein
VRSCVADSAFIVRKEQLQRDFNERLQELEPSKWDEFRVYDGGDKLGGTVEGVMDDFDMKHGLEVFFDRLKNNRQLKLKYLTPR